MYALLVSSFLNSLESELCEVNCMKTNNNMCYGKWIIIHTVRYLLSLCSLTSVYTSQKYLDSQSKDMLYSCDVCFSESSVMLSVISMAQHLLCWPSNFSGITPFIIVLSRLPVIYNFSIYASFPASVLHMLSGLLWDEEVKAAYLEQQPQSRFLEYHEIL